MPRARGDGRAMVEGLDVWCDLLEETAVKPGGLNGGIDSNPHLYAI